MNDSSPVKIYYDEVAVFDAIHCPEPFVTRSDQVNYGTKKLGQTTSLTLNGQITGADFSSIIEGQNKLLSGFSNDFKLFKIEEDSEVIYENLVRVDSISFEASKMVGIVPFTISLTAYEDKFFPSEYSGVINPANSVNYSQAENGQITISRSVSAKGINTKSANGKSNALQNAITYVQSLTGLGNVTMPYFATESGDVNNLILTSQNENIDRFEATYSVDETYIYSANPSGSSTDFYGNSLTYPLFKRASVAHQSLSNDSAYNSFSISNEWSTNKTQLDEDYSSASMEYLRNRVAKYIQTIKDGALPANDGITQRISLMNPELANYTTFSYSITEDALEHKISFNLDFSDDPSFDSEYGVYFTENLTSQKDSLRDVDEVNYSFTITPFGLQSVSVDNEYTYYQNHSYLQKKSYNYLKGKLLTGVNTTIEKYCMSKVKQFYSVLLTGQYDFEDQFSILSIDQKNTPSDGIISIQCQASNAPKHGEDIFNNADFTLTVTPQMNNVTINKSVILNGHYLMTEHDDYDKREAISLSVNAVANPSGALEENKTGVLSDLTNLAGSIVNQVSGENFRISSQSKSFSKETLQAAIQVEASHQRSADSYYFNQSPILRDGSQE